MNGSSEIPLRKSRSPILEVDVRPFSNSLQLLFHPFRVYERLARAEDERDVPPSILRGVARLLFVLATTVAITASGRFAPFEIVGAAISFAWVPCVQLLALAVALGLTARHVSLRKAFALYLEGQGVWLIVLTAIVGSCLFVPVDAPPATSLLRLAPILVGVAFLSGAFLNYALFRAGLGLGRGRALVATATYYVVAHVIIFGYFLAAGQLLPILR